MNDKIVGVVVPEEIMRGPKCKFASNDKTVCVVLPFFVCHISICRLLHLFCSFFPCRPLHLNPRG